MNHHSTGAGAIVLTGADRRPEQLGGKGASLDQLIDWGLQVPPTAVVTTTAYRRVAADPAIRDLVERIRAGHDASEAEVDETFANAAFPADTAAEVLATAAAVGGGSRLAVRSSATVEDLEESSFAGQYRSVLDVDPTDETAVLNAVRAVFASLWHPSPTTYRRVLGVDDEDIAMAAVLMRMVPASRAGVVFTTDPADPESARIESVAGLGESLVSGERTPDAYVVPRQGPADAPTEVRAALAESLRIETLSGLPHDVEWAWADEQLWVVQARPITVSETGDGFDSERSDTDLTTAGIAEMLPGVLPPLRWQTAAHLVDSAFLQMFDALMPHGRPIPADRSLLHRVRGRAAMDFGLVQTLTGAFSPEAAAQLEERYFGEASLDDGDDDRVPTSTAAPTTGRLRAAIARARHSRRVARAQRRAVLDADIAIEVAHHALGDAPDLSVASERDLRRRRIELLDLAVRTAIAQMGVAAAASAAFDRIVLILTPHLGDHESTRHARAITTGVGIAATVHADASAAVFAGPTWVELDRTPLDVAPRVDENGARDELLGLLALTPSWGSEGTRVLIRRRALGHAIDDAVTQLRRRENAKAALLRIGGAVRAIHLEFGARLVDAGRLADPTDIELLSERELIDALAGETPSPTALRKRRRWRERYEASPPLPTRFTGEPTPPEAAGPEAGDRVIGWAASGGVFRGRAVALDDPGETFADGTVLVASATDASWAPLFARAGAVVVERGGPLSHASILARELGVPAVVNAPSAMRILDGRTVVVDGDAGTVDVIDDPATDDPAIDDTADDESNAEVRP